jgi:hypothetical protein
MRYFRSPLTRVGPGGGVGPLEGGAVAILEAQALAPTVGGHLAGVGGGQLSFPMAGFQC